MTWATATCKQSGWTLETCWVWAVIKENLQYDHIYMSGTCKLSTMLFVDTDLCSKTTKKNEGMINSKFRVVIVLKRGWNQRDTFRTSWVMSKYKFLNWVMNSWQFILLPFFGDKTHFIYTVLYLQYLILKFLKMMRQISDRKYLSCVQKQTK